MSSSGVHPPAGGMIPMQAEYSLLQTGQPALEAVLLPGYPVTIVLQILPRNPGIQFAMVPVMQGDVDNPVRRVNVRDGNCPFRLFR